MFFALNLLIQFFCCTIFWQLFRQLTLDSRINQFVFQRRKIVGVLFLKFVNNIKVRKSLLNDFNDSNGFVIGNQRHNERMNSF